MATRVIGRFAPRAVPAAPPDFDRFIIPQDGFTDRLGIIPSSITPSRMNSIRQKAADGDLGDLYELYLKMIATDARIGGIVGSLKSAIAGIPLKVVAGKGTNASERRLAEDYKLLTEEALHAIDEHSFISDLFTAYVMGVRVMQMTWTIEEFPRGRFIALPTQPKPIPGAALCMESTMLSERYGELKIRTIKAPQGVFVSDLDPRRIFVVEDGHARGFYDTKGALRRVLGWWILKMYAQLWWAEFAEMHGQPIRVGRYNPEAGSKERTELRSFLKAVGRNKWGIFPTGVDVQLLESNMNGQNMTFRDIINMANNEIAVALAGQTGITTDSAQGSRSKLEVLSDIRHEIKVEIAALISKGLSKFVAALLWTNYGPGYVKRLAPRAKPLVVRDESITEKVAYYSSLAATGFPVPAREISDQTGIPIAEEGELVLTDKGVVVFDGFNVTGDALTSDQDDAPTEETDGEQGRDNGETDRSG